MTGVYMSSSVDLAINIANLCIGVAIIAFLIARARKK